MFRSNLQPSSSGQKRIVLKMEKRFLLKRWKLSTSVHGIISQNTHMSIHLNSRKNWTEQSTCWHSGLQWEPPGDEWGRHHTGTSTPYFHPLCPLLWEVPASTGTHQTRWGCYLWVCVSPWGPGCHPWRHMCLEAEMSLQKLCLLQAVHSTLAHQDIVFRQTFCEIK